jgi:hypothetical protein
MEKEVVKKIERLVSLSLKFSKSEREVIGDPEAGKNTLLGCGTFSTANWQMCSSQVSMKFQIDGRELFVDTDGAVKAKDNKRVTSAEKIRLDAEVRATLSEEFDEYVKLQQDLSEYFNAINKIAQ